MRSGLKQITTIVRGNSMEKKFEREKILPIEESSLNLINFHLMNHFGKTSLGKILLIFGLLFLEQPKKVSFFTLI